MSTGWYFRENVGAGADRFWYGRWRTQLWMCMATSVDILYQPIACPSIASYKVRSASIVGRYVLYCYQMVIYTIISQLAQSKNMAQVVWQYHSLPLAEDNQAILASAAT